MFLLIILVQEVVVWILLYVQLSYFLVEYLAEFVDVLLVLCRDEEAVLIEFAIQVFFRSSSGMFSFSIGVRSSSSFLPMSSCLSC